MHSRHWISLFQGRINRVCQSYLVKLHTALMNRSALLSFNLAVSHLYHFCSLLPRDPYTDPRPAFAFEDLDQNGAILATVTLPNSVDPGIRRARGLQAWKTERMAKIDAAFEAYIALYKAGL